MYLQSKLSKKRSLFLFAGLFITVNQIVCLAQQSQAEYEDNISMEVALFKQDYELGEPVPMKLIIANHGSEPVYYFIPFTSINDPTVLKRSLRVEDHNGLKLRGNPIPRPPPPPPYYSMRENGKVVYTIPIHKIEGHSMVVLTIRDAIENYQLDMSEGTFYLLGGLFGLFHNVEDIIVRENLPTRLWVRADIKRVNVYHKVKPERIKIEIREKTEGSKSLASKTLIDREAVAVRLVHLRDNFIREMMELASQKDSTKLPPQMEHSWHDTRHLAISFLGYIRTEKAVPVLLDNLTLHYVDPNPRVDRRSPLARLKGYQGWSPATTALIRIGMPAIYPTIYKLKLYDADTAEIHDPDSMILSLYCTIIREILGKELGQKRLMIAIEEEQDEKRKNNLQAALSYYEKRFMRRK